VAAKSYDCHARLASRICGPRRAAPAACVGVHGLGQAAQQRQADLHASYVARPSGRAIATAVAGHALRNSTLSRTSAGTASRGTGAKPKRGK